MTKRICPVCNYGILKPTGKLPDGRQEYICSKCGYRTL